MSQILVDCLYQAIKNVPINPSALFGWFSIKSYFCVVGKFLLGCKKGSNIIPSISSQGNMSPFSFFFIQWPENGKIILSIFSLDNINSFSFLFHSKIKIRGNYSNHSSQDNINLSIFPSKSANKEPPQTLFHNIVSIPSIFKNKRITIFLSDNTKFLTSFLKMQIYEN